MSRVITVILSFYLMCLKRYFMMGQRSWLKTILILQNMLYPMRARYFTTKASFIPYYGLLIMIEQLLSYRAILYVYLQGSITFVKLFLIHLEPNFFGRTLVKNFQKLEAGWTIRISPRILLRKQKLYGRMLPFR